MAQHDYVIANGTGAAVRSDLNNALAAIVSNNSGATEPATMYAYQWWADTSTGLLKLRNAANNAWITLRELDGTLTIEAGTVSAPGLAFASDLNTGIYSPGADQVAITTNGVERVEWGTTEVVFNDGGTNYDFRIEGDTVDSLFFVDASTDRVGLGTSSPSALFHVAQDSSDGTQARITGATNQNYQLRWGFDTTNLVGRIQSIHVGTAYRALALNPDGGNVGIGTQTPGYTLDVSGQANIKPAAGYNALFQQASTSLRINYLNDAASANVSAAYRATDFSWQKGDGSEIGRFDSSGRFLVGTSTARGTGLVQSSYAGGAAMTLMANTNSAAEAELHFCKSRGSGSGDFTVVQSGDFLGSIYFRGADGSVDRNGAAISAVVDGTPGSGDLPTRLTFSTTADGASSPTERMRITSGGFVFLGKTSDDFATAGFAYRPNSDSHWTTNGTNIVAFRRNSNDGNLIEFYQDANIEGSISVSGTTVSYNGAHLSRWSQLPGGTERTEILRGTVLSNINEMCGWDDEENEQLNRMKVSDVEGDPNVAGVFQAWDDDDDTYTDDFYCAMTGDFIIRIAEGVTVQRGDLLMSAGDGTAKPQDDDIIRSKTVAKVTSTYVACTYDDGSYCVPCVLMAC